jgi:hypothetical protein
VAAVADCAAAVADGGPDDMGRSYGSVGRTAAQSTDSVRSGYFTDCFRLFAAPVVGRNLDAAVTSGVDEEIEVFVILCGSWPFLAVMC